MSNGYERYYEEDPEVDDLMQTIEADGYDTEEEPEEEPEAAEAMRRYRRPPVRTARGVRTTPPRTPRGVVTQEQLRIALERVNKQIGVESAAIRKLDSRIAAIDERLARESATRKKGDTRETRSLRQMRDMSILLPVLMQPTTKPISDFFVEEDHTLQLNKELKGTKVAIDTGDSLTMMLPLILMMGIDGGNCGMSGDNSTMLMLVLALTLWRK